MIVFSTSTQFLDVLEAALKYIYPGKVLPLRFDARISDKEREAVVSAFSAVDAHMPLLISAGAGGVSLNLQAASRVVICETW